MDPTLRLPAIRDMVDLPVAALPATHLSDPFVPGPVHRQPSSNASWTAINHPSAVPPPPAQDALPQVNSNLSPPSHLRERWNQPATSAVMSIEPRHGRVSFTAAAEQTVGKPIAAERQDSAFPSVPSRTATTVPPGNPSFRAGDSPETHHGTVVRDAVDHPDTPPSDSTAQSYPARPSTYDRERELPPYARAQKEDDHTTIHHRKRSHSDLTRPTMTLLPQTALFVDERNSMPPPPVPAPAPTPAPAPAPAPVLPPGSAATGSLLSPPNTGAPQSTRSHPPGPTSTEEDDPEKCAYCQQAWSFPPLDSKPVRAPASHTYVEMAKSVDAVRTLLCRYEARKGQDYEEWKQLHQGGHCRCVSTQPGSKRTSDESQNNESLPSKSLKLSRESPRRYHLTPAPEQAINSGSANEKTTLFFKADYGPRVPINRTVGTILRMDGAPSPRYIPPANDSSNMWHDYGKSKRVNGQEETAH